MVSVCDKCKEKLMPIQKQYPYLKSSTNYFDLLKSPKINAVVISTPASTHYKIAKECLLSNKHVLLEKPLTLTVEEGAKLVNLAIERNLILMVGHTFLYNNAIIKIKELLDNGDLGEIYYLHATRTHLGLIRDDVNAAWDLAPHDIAIFRYLLGRNPNKVSAFGRKCLKNGLEDVVFINLEFPGGVVASIHACWISSNKVRQIEVVGSKGRILFDDLNHLETIKFYQKGISVERSVNSYGEYQFLLRDGDIISPKIEMSEPLKNECQHFIDCIVNKTSPLTNGSNGLDVVRILVAVEESLKNDNKTVEIRYNEDWIKED